MRIEEYADATDWESWQAEYRFGAFYIFPPQGTIEAIDALRVAFDPRSASFCQAHISVSEPLAAPLTQSQLVELRGLLSSCSPFIVRYGPLRSFPPYPGVTYAVQPEKAVQDLKTLVHGTSIFGGVPFKREDIAPHMTIAEFITLERTDDLLRQLRGKVPTGVFTCNSLEYAVPNEHFYFERILSIPLGQPPDSSLAG